jgi:hypothetical protein
MTPTTPSRPPVPPWCCPNRSVLLDVEFASARRVDSLDQQVFDLMQANASLENEHSALRQKMIEKKAPIGPARHEDVWNIPRMWSVWRQGAEPDRLESGTASFHANSSNAFNERSRLTPQQADTILDHDDMVSTLSFSKTDSNLLASGGCSSEIKSDLPRFMPPFSSSLHGHASQSERLIPCQNKNLVVPQVTMDCGNIPACFLVGCSPSARLQGQDVV